jgi:L-alanine-DL-glutamate epimerase-like enolase superfamily enzyme
LGRPAPKLSFSQEPRGAVPIKVTEVETIRVSRHLFVRIHTNEGITGLGELATWDFLKGS